MKIPGKIQIAFMVVLLFAGCGKDEETPPTPPETGTVTDIDGHVYATVKIGNQWWMAENLQVTKYRNGLNIVKMSNSDSTGWRTTVAGAYSVYSETEPSPGLLYNWYAISDTGNIAPAGWHIPSDEEWKQLERTLGMSAAAADQGGWRGTNEGDKLKVKAPENWTVYQQVWGTNESGFAARSGSCKLFDARKGDPFGATGFWWSSTPSEGTKYCSSCTQAYYRYLDCKNSNIFRSTAYKNYGFSIRCVKD